MHSLKFQIKTLAPLLLPGRNGDVNTVSSLTYIPGYTLLGALAGHYIKTNQLGQDAHRNPDFYRFFLSGQLKFLPAYPVWQDNYGTSHRSYPCPLSIQSEKDGQQSLHDLLHTQPEQITKTLFGYTHLKGKSIHTNQPKMQLFYHHGRRVGESGVEEPVPFTYQALEKGQSFEGLILGDELVVQDFHQAFSKPHTLFLGRSRNAQYGKVSLEFQESVPFASEVSNIGFDPQNEEDWEDGFSLTLLSDTILLNKEGTPSVSKETLQSELPEGWIIQKAFIREEITENFVSIWGLRKPSQVCFKAGSCFWVTAPQGSNLALVVKKLHLEGLGERKHEGFGRVICGLQQAKTYQQQEPTLVKISRPTHSIPQKTRDILIFATKQKLKGIVQEKALDRAHQFSRIPPPSLLGRLEAILKNSSSQQFKKQISGLKGTAKDRLKKCRDKRVELLDFLQQDPIRDLDLQGLVRALYEKFPNTLSYPDTWHDEFFRMYWQSFLTGLRKQAKTKGGNQRD